jgi:hypothetical protein
MSQFGLKPIASQNSLECGNYHGIISPVDTIVCRNRQAARRISRDSVGLTTGIALLDPSERAAGPARLRWRVRDNIGLETDFDREPALDEARLEVGSGRPETDGR